ncbi:MAG: GNAT family N-acetyltransferase [Magnetococcus sp. YQC-9]
MMSIRVEHIQPAQIKDYESLVLADERSLVYSSLPYVELLKCLSPEAACLHWLARDETGAVRGSLICLIQKGPWGFIANVLPFFSGPAGLVVPDGDLAVKSALLGHYLAEVRARGCVAATFVTSPLDVDSARYHAWLAPTFVDERVGLITPLPPPSGGLEQALLEMCRQKTRPPIRKSLRVGFQLEVAGSEENWSFLRATHRHNMAQLNAAARPDAFFDYMRSPDSASLMRRLYVARLDGTPVAALLLLDHHRTVEYFVPVIVEAYRSLQPLSFLIFHAMRESVEAGKRWWNWGGTGLTQSTLYRFKKGFGAVDHRYFYFVHLFDPALLRVDRQSLMTAYPFFFTYPFGQVPLSDSTSSGLV